MTQKITPFLWFDGNAEEAANFYVSVFRRSRIVEMARYGEGGPGPSGSVMTVSFELEGQRFVGLNGGPHYKFSPAVSFYIDCATQGEVDELWDKLLAGGGEASRCGWLTDRFGVSWQVIPGILKELLQHRDPAVSARVMSSMMGMVKIDVQALEAAARG